MFLVSNILNSEEYDQVGDVNQDGMVNVVDIVILVNKILNT